MKKRSDQKRGPKPAITLEVARRVGERVGRGLTLQMALAAEGKVRINLETWKKALQINEQFAVTYGAGRAKFADWATQRLAESKDLANLRWLLVRRHPDRFCKPKPAVATSSSGKGIDYKANYEQLVANREAMRARLREISPEHLKELKELGELVARKRAEQAREAEQQERARQNGNSKEEEHPTQKRGPKPAITLAVVKRVAERVGRGVTLEQALALEEKTKINLETWKKSLGTHKQFVAVYEAGQAKFVDWATQRLAESKDPANLRWLLERCQPEGSVTGIDYKAKYEELLAEHEAIVARAQENSALDLEELGRKAAREEQARETERQKGAGQNGNGHSPAASEDGKVESWKDGGMEKSEGRHEQPTQPEPATCKTATFRGGPMPETGPGQGPTGPAARTNIIRPAVKTAQDRLLESMGAYMGS